MEDEPRDEELIARISQGNEDALVALMARHKQAVYHFVYRYMSNEPDTAEVTEETFFKVYQNAARYKQKATPKTWIFSIALNLARDRLRRDKKRRGQLSLSQDSGNEGSFATLFDRIDSGSISPSQQLRSEDDLHQIRAVIAKLPEKLKFPFIFCVLEEHTYDECAAILKASRKTVETRIYRARQLLRRGLEKYFEKT